MRYKVKDREQQIELLIKKHRIMDTPTLEKALVEYNEGIRKHNAEIDLLEAQITGLHAAQPAGYENRIKHLQAQQSEYRDKIDYMMMWVEAWTIIRAERET